MNNYIINEDTLMIISNDLDSSIVYDKLAMIKIDKNVNEIVDNSCKYYGSSLKGRIKASREMIDYEYKLPVIIEESRELVFFPTASVKNSNLAWINLDYVYYFEYRDNKLNIKFKNGVEINLDLSYYIFDKQLIKAYKLKSVLKVRKLIKSI